jgi:hypothetical protein
MRWAIAAALLLALPAAAFEPSAALRSACRTDALYHCAGPIASYLVAKGTGEAEQKAIGACMHAHWNGLSDGCREVSARELHLPACALHVPLSQRCRRASARRLK